MLGEAARSGVACDPPAPLFEAHGLAGAYAVQSLLAEAAEAAGRRVVGRKIGLTSAAVQAQLGDDQPEFGLLLDDMEYGDGREIPLSRLLPSRAEAEIGSGMSGEDRKGVG